VNGANLPAAADRPAITAPERLAGCGDLDKLFGHHDRVITPWPRAPRRKHQPAFDRAVLARLEQSPVDLVEVDPRTLWASQPWVLRHHAAYYLTGEWERTGRTSADRHLELNRYPVVVMDHRGRPVIAAGHHRAAAALVTGQSLLVRAVATGSVCAITPLLFWDPNSDPVDARTVVQRIECGQRCAVASLDLAYAILVALGVPADEATHRIERVRRQATSATPIRQDGA
jgi:hypothetical protein